MEPAGDPKNLLKPFSTLRRFLFSWLFFALLGVAPVGPLGGPKDLWRIYLKPFFGFFGSFAAPGFFFFLCGRGKDLWKPLHEGAREGAGNIIALIGCRSKIRNAIRSKGSL